MRTILPTLALVAALATAAFASDDHGGHSGMAEGVHTKGEVHAISGDTVNLTHDPIPEISWPSMTMDLKLLEGAETDGVQAGDEVMIMLEKGPDGVYGIRALEKLE